MDSAEELAERLLKGIASCDACPDLNILVNDAKSGIISKKEFTDIIRYHLSVNDKINEVI